MTLEHPNPTNSTIKYLYAHAFGCAFEGCRRPLYTIDPETGQRTLASRVAHICARSEGGPRWDPQQTSEENRSEDNLVLMCIEHAAAIDDPALIQNYSAVRLRSMKQLQLKLFDEIRQGWELSADMADAVAEASFKDASINFGPVATISLGGEGGKAPGAGGGGGGALGKNARGGRGGKGGNTRIDSTEHTLPFDGESEPANSATQHEAPPGAGGGGMGAIGEDAIGGAGGNGGNRVVGVYDLEALRRDGFCGRVEIVVGEAGTNARLPNQLPTSGQDSIVRFLREDGSVVKEVRAEGGLAAMPDLSRFLDEWVELSGDLLESTGFRVTTLMVVNAAEQPGGGNLSILGGDWTWLSIPVVPTDAIFNVVASFRFRALSQSAPTAIFISLYDPLGQERARAPVILSATDFPNGMARFIVPLGSPLDQPGPWQIRVWSGSQVLSFIVIDVRESAAA